MSNPLDKNQSLALTIHSEPGAFALLIGSGASQSAGIPTGWQIVKDLIDKIRTLTGDSTTDELSAQDWFKSKFGQQADYSSLLDELSDGPAQRQALLRDYFDPTPEERAAGIKVPQPAHLAIAEMAAKGYFKIIITTNFDRLLEQAFAQIGHEVKVVSSSDDIGALRPVQHYRTLIIKLHGDYLDIRLRNTVEELEAYEDTTAHYVRKILNEYGLLVCGWSGEWDHGLRQLICTRELNAPYPAFMTYRETAPTEMCQQSMHLLSIENADSFFTLLKTDLEKLETQSQLATPEQVRGRLTLLKSYLIDATTIVRAREQIEIEARNVRGNMKEQYKLSHEYRSREDALDLMDQQRIWLSTLMNYFALGGYCAASTHSPAFERALQIVSNRLDIELSANRNLRFDGVHVQYSGLLLLYTMGVTAIANRMYGLIRPLLLTPIQASHGTVPALELLVPSYVIPERVYRYSDATHQYKYHPAKFVLDAIHPVISDFIAEGEIEESFYEFEYVLNLIQADRHYKPGEAVHVPLGYYARNVYPSDRDSLPARIGMIAELKRAEWDLIRLGFFGGSYDIFLSVKQGLDAEIENWRHRLW